MAGHRRPDLIRRNTAPVKSIYRTRAAQETIRTWCTKQLDQWPIPHERSTLAMQGTQTHVVQAGAGGTVLFIPGTNFNAAVSGPIAAALYRAGHRIVIPDVPGQPGLSTGDRVTGPERADCYGAWLNELIEKIHNGRPVTVIGHSLGAAIALSASSPHITRRVLLSPGGLIKLSITPAVLAASTSWFLRPTPARSARLLKTMLAPGHEPSEQLTEWMTLVARNTRTSGDPGRLRNLNSTPESTVVASGRHDVFLPPSRLQDPVRDALQVNLQLVDDAGHLIVDEQPDLVADLVT